MANEIPQKPIHSLIVDTGPLIKNAVSTSTIINSAEEIFTTPAIISEIRDEATRSRVQTTLMPFLKVRTPRPASYDAVVAFSKKTGDYSVLSRQDLGILALAYEVHCERNGGPWGLREAPKQPIKMRPGEAQPVEEDDEAEKEVVPETKIEEQEPRAESKTEGQETQPESKTEESETQTESKTEEPEVQPKIKPKRIHKKKEAKRLARELQAEQQNQAVITSEAVKTTETAATPELATEQAAPHGAIIGDEQDAANLDDSKPEAPDQESTIPDYSGQGIELNSAEITEQSSHNTDAPEQSAEPTLEAPKEERDASQSENAPSSVQESAVVEDSAAPESSPPHDVQEKIPSEQPAHEDSASAPAQEDSYYVPAQEDLAQDMSTLNITTPPSPPTTEDESDEDWITPSNLHDHQAADAGLLPAPTSSPTPQLDVATMTTDFAMQNVLLQMNLSLLSTNMQRIKRLTSKVLRCHACFLVVRDMSKQFCPRCGGASLLRVNCSTSAKGEFRLHLAKNYQYNKRGDKYSIPKPIAGTANTKWNGIGGGKGGWGRDLVLSEDQKEYAQKVGQEKKARDLMDEDYMPGILTGDRAGRSGGRPKVGAGRNVNSKKRF